MASSGAAAAAAAWEGLPDDVLHLIYAHLSPRDVAALQQVSTVFQRQILNIGWPNILSRHSISHITLTPRHTKWSPRSLSRHNLQTLHSIKHHKFLARQIGRDWEKGCMPIMLLEEDRMVVAAGSKLLIHELASRARYQGKEVSGITELYTASQPTARDDITGIVKLPSDQYMISTIGGKLQRITIPPISGKEHTYLSSRVGITAHYHHPAKNSIETLSSDGNTIISAAHDGLVSLFSASSPWIPPITTKIPSRPWSSLINMSASTPFAAIGTSSLNPLQLYPLRQTGFDTGSPTILSGPTTRSAVYSITGVPPTMAMPYTNSPSSLLLSAWFDGHARLHDLRSASKSGAVMEWSDPWSDSSLYSVTFTGMGCIVGGAGRHGLIHVWDPRRGSKTGWSAFIPGRPESPIYDLKGEGSRVWGVTSSAAFVLAFDILGNEGELGSKGWGIVPPRLRASQFQPRWNGKGIRRFQDFATGYRHQDRSLRLFDSLGGMEFAVPKGISNGLKG